MALWVGLLAGVVGIALSTFAIWFAWKTNERADRADRERAQTLVKVESLVDRLSSDVREVIKDAVLRVNPPAPVSPGASGSIKELAAGLADELRLGLGTPGYDTSIAEPDRREVKLSGVEGGPSEEEADSDENLGDRIDTLEKRLQEQMRYMELLVGGTPAVLGALDSMSFVAQELARHLGLIEQRHLSNDEYWRLHEIPMIRDAIHELRGRGILAPLRGARKNGKFQRVYWFVPDLVEPVREALELLAPVPDRVAKRVHEALADVGYTEKPSASDLDGGNE